MSKQTIPEKDYSLNYKEAKFKWGTRVIVARITPGDEGISSKLYCTGTVIGHFLPYALVQMDNDVYSILERDLEACLG